MIEIFQSGCADPDYIEVGDMVMNYAADDAYSFIKCGATMYVAPYPGMVHEEICMLNDLDDECLDPGDKGRLWTNAKYISMWNTNDLFSTVTYLLRDDVIDGNYYMCCNFKNGVITIPVTDIISHHINNVDEAYKIYKKQQKKPKLSDDAVNNIEKRKFWHHYDPSWVAECVRRTIKDIIK